MKPTSFPSHYPAHESLQDFARRLGKTPAEAYAAWSNRPYPAFSVMRPLDVYDAVTEEHVGRKIARVFHDARGSGLRLVRS